MNTTEITEKLMEPFPSEVIEEKQGLLYIPHEIIRDRLISATGNNFDWSIDQVLFRDDGVTRRANDRATGEPRRPLSMLVIGTLTIPGLGSRAGIGAHPLDEGAGEDAAYKSAESDAIKRAAMAFGVGLRQLYIETGEAKRPNKPVRRQEPRADQRLTDSQWAEHLRAALRDRDAAGYRKLVDQAETASRWCALIAAADSDTALDWIKRQIERKGIQDVTVKQAIAKKEEELSPKAPDPGNADPRWEPDASERSLPGSITRNQLGTIFGLGSKVGMTDEMIKVDTWKRYGDPNDRDGWSRKRMSWQQADEYITALRLIGRDVHPITGEITDVSVQ